MRFGDSSAIVPLTIRESRSDRQRELLDEDPQMAVWWASPVECGSAIAPQRRDGAIESAGERQARGRLDDLAMAWTEILPSDELRRLAGALHLRHPLRAADSLQLAAAITAAGVPPRIAIVTLDDRLAEAAAREGFTTLP
jgi:hypothetical protein